MGSLRVHLRKIPLVAMLVLSLIVGACAGAPQERALPTYPPGTTVAEATPTPGPVTSALSTPRPSPSPSPATILNAASAATPSPNGGPGPTPTSEPTPTPQPTPTPSSSPTPAPPQKVWRIGLLEDVTSTNIWDILGPSGTASNIYVFKNRYPSLYVLSEFHSHWVPSLAKGKPSDLRREGDFWTLQVELKEGVRWSDGVDVTAHDVAFTVNMARELDLPGRWALLVDPDYFERAEALGDHAVKFFFKGKPGLAHWEYGLSQTSIVARHYWEPVVSEALLTGPRDQQQTTLFAHVPTAEPTAGEMLFSKWEPGVLVEMRRNPNYYWEGSTVREYPNGAYVEEKPGVFQFRDYGQAQGDPSLTVTRGLGPDSVVFRVYEDQRSAVIALRSDQIDYVLAPQGIVPSLRKHLQGRNIRTVQNPANEFHYLGFNRRRPPFDSRGFRQAVATLIDKEFITNVVLQGTAIPMYSLVPEGNAFWWNPDVPNIGKGISREERIIRAVDTLKVAGFSWYQEPQWDEDQRTVQAGEGLKLPNGQPVPLMDLLVPDAETDPVPAAAARWIVEWLNEAGIPIRAKAAAPADTGELRLEESFDMWVLAQKLTAYPRLLADLFHSKQAVPGGANLGGYNNPEFDELAEGFLAEVDMDNAQAKAFEIQAFIAQNLPVVTLFTAPIVEAYRDDLVTWAFTEVLDGVQNSFDSINGPMSSTLIS